MHIEKLIEGETVIFTIRNWEKGNEKFVKGIFLEKKENEVVFKPISHHTDYAQYEGGYDIHNVSVYPISNVVGIQQYTFSNEIQPYIQQYYEKYKNQKEMRATIQILQNEIQKLNEQIETIETEKGEVCEQLYECYFSYAEEMEISFFVPYFRTKLEQLWNELSIQKQKENKNIHFRKPNVVGRNNQVVVTFQLEKKHDYIEDVPRCHYNNCRCHSEAAEDVFFEKYSHPFSLNSLKRFDITHRDSIECDYKYENMFYYSNEVTAYYIINEFEIHTNTKKVQPERILELLSEFLIAYA